MKNKIYSFFTFGLFLVAIGIVSSIIFKWQQSNVLIAVGLVFELLAGILYSWQKIKGNNGKKDK
ncbi:MAG: hypothetical protein KGV44_04450 [Flavobacteriaceae bacterium]|nr:hypothetical protein [Flavobacteriaceae bacterium]